MVFKPHQPLRKTMADTDVTVAVKIINFTYVVKGGKS